jgi:hypothetical protein
MMRAWLAILSDRHPDILWVPVSNGETEQKPDESGDTVATTILVPG